MATKIVEAGKIIIPTYSEAHLGTRFATMVTDYADLKTRIKEFEKDRARLNDKIFAQLAGSGFKKVLARDYVVSIIDTDRSNLSKEKLVEGMLAFGLAASDVDEIIGAATTTTHSAYLRVDAKKEE